MCRFFEPSRPLGHICRIFAQNGGRHADRAGDSLEDPSHPLAHRARDALPSHSVRPRRAACARPLQPGRVEAGSTPRRCGFEGPSAHRPEQRRATGREAAPGHCNWRHPRPGEECRRPPRWTSRQSLGSGAVTATLAAKPSTIDSTFRLFTWQLACRWFENLVDTLRW